MNQILYKGHTFGGVGEDVTNKQYGEVTIHNPITDEDETYNPIGGENAEIFNAYKENIASSGYTTVIGLNNKDIRTETLTAENFISGCYNTSIDSEYMNISGIGNFVKDSMETLVTGVNNNVYKTYQGLISGSGNIVINAQNPFIHGHDNIIKNQTRPGDTSIAAVGMVIGRRNVIDYIDGAVAVIGSENKLLRANNNGTIVCGMNNEMNNTNSAFVCGDNHIGSVQEGILGGTDFQGYLHDGLVCGSQINIDWCITSLVSGISFNISDVCDQSVLIGQYYNLHQAYYSIINIKGKGYNNNYTEINNIEKTILVGENISATDITNSLVLGTNIKTYPVTNSIIFGTVKVNGSITDSLILGNNTTPINNDDFTTTGEVLENSAILGNNNTISKMKDLILIGNNNNSINDSASYFISTIIGFNNNNTSCKSFIYGESNITAQSANNTYLIGESNNMSNGAAYTYVIGRSNTSTNGANNNIILGKENTVTNGVINSCTIGNNLYNNFTKSILLGHFNSYTSGQQIQDKLLILGNGTADNERSNCLEINQDGSQEIILQDKALSGTLGIGKIKITQEYIQFESLKNDSNNTKETITFTFEDLKQIKQNSQLPNLDNNLYPTT